MRVVCIGDSNTYGYEPTSYTGSRYGRDVRWTGRLEAEEVINEGVNGMGIPRTGEASVRLAKSTQPGDAIVIMLGTNDLLEGADAAEAGRRMDAFVSRLAGMVKDARMILIAPPVMKEGAWVAGQKLIHESELLKRAYEQIAAKHGIEFCAADDWNVSLTFDGVHFTAEGHRNFAAGLNRKLKSE